MGWVEVVQGVGDTSGDLTSRRRSFSFSGHASATPSPRAEVRNAAAAPWAVFIFV